MGYQPIGRIEPVAPAPSLVSSASPLPNVDWRTGIEWSPVCQPSTNLDICPAGERIPPNGRAVVHSNPFTLYTPQSCDMPVDGEDMTRIVNALTEIHTTAQLELALWMGEGLPVSDLEQVTLRRSAIDVAQASPLDLDDGVAQLLVHYNEATGGNGGALIHIPAGLAPFALGGGGGGARLCWPEGNTYRGPLQSLVVPGPGYPNGFSPNGPDGHGPLLSAPGVAPEEYAGNEVGTSWIYITGPVEYAVTPVEVIPEHERDRVIPFTNEYEVWGQREAIFRFDPCSTFATLVVNPAPMPEVS